MALTVNSAITSTVSPVLTSPFGSALSPTSATGSVNASKSGGTLYWALSTSSSPPSEANIIAGTAGIAQGNQAVTQAGAQNLGTIAGLSESETYYLHFVHISGGSSGVVTSGAFATPATTTGDFGSTLSGGSVTANRISGVAPFGALLSASASSTESRVVLPYHDIEWKWNMGVVGTYDTLGC